MRCCPSVGTDPCDYPRCGRPEPPPHLRRGVEAAEIEGLGDRGDLALRRAAENLLAAADAFRAIHAVAVPSKASNLLWAGAPDRVAVVVVSPEHRDLLLSILRGALCSGGEP